jgi:preprotein translocase subunit SecD
MNRYPLWKYILIGLVLAVGLLYALPNLFGEDPAVQVSPNRGAALNAGIQATIRDVLQRDGLEPKSISLEADRLLVRLSDTEAQIKASDLISEALGPGYTVALNLAPAAPDWLRAINGLPMYLGLDLRGGVHFLMEVDVATALRQREESYAADMRTELRAQRIRYLSVERAAASGIVGRFAESADLERAVTLLAEQNRGLQFTTDEAGLKFTAAIGEDEQEELRRFALQQNITTLRNRVNELGVAEPVIQQQGTDRIVVQLPGVQDTARAKEILGATATLEFRMVDEDHIAADAAATGRVPAGARLYRERNGQPVLLERKVMLTGDYITDAASGIDQQTGGPAVFITLDSRGARRFSDATADAVGRLMAVVFIENKTETRTVDGETRKETQLVEEVINIARIRERLSKRFQITGLDGTNEARDLALLLRAGALAAPVEIVEERTVGPSLGQENINRGIEAVLVGFLLVVVFMGVYYRVFGLVANLALACNLVLIIAILSMLQATLTLPGIAGIVLTVGMAVDANVLIFERIREELRVGNTPQASIHAGYEKALSTIADSNITTLLAALVLFGFGTGPVKGFAVTLSIGIVCSMFTAIMGTRAVINLIYGGRRIRRLAI